MGISTMLKLLQEKESGKIVLVNIGNFYVASGKDAVLLNKVLDLKLTCLEKGICKVGFPISALEKYTNKIEEKQYSYIVYRYIAKEVKLEITKIHKAKNKNEITQEKANCLLCKGIKAYPKEDKYIEAVAKLYEKEDEINRAKEQRKKRKIWFQKKNKRGGINMNFCYIVGKIISKINFEFIIESKDYSIATFKIKLSNNSIINVEAYNEQADYCYLKLHEENIIAIEGKMKNNCILLEQLYILK